MAGILCKIAWTSKKNLIVDYFITVEHDGNTEEEFNADVVFKWKYPRIGCEMGGGVRVSLTAPPPFYSRLLERYLKTERFFFSTSDIYLLLFVWNC